MGRMSAADGERTWPPGWRAWARPLRPSRRLLLANRVGVSKLAIAALDIWARP